ncbi:MarR family transcriptional regulator [Bosea sp. Leaf344]|uniref:MarR family winged helix-turn-helix transcriptional regulator n=1 Tax=Bosea sp. Leaf344 TaxID=1736346 RepID=UPI0006F2A07B|nr:MarR family winged helix-turn-helix transcriptional regulator [Bosea sp. Leaf344]KQU54582.1 MarR family transcriptional regulator [Bosea sp. Leaf344]
MSKLALEHFLPYRLNRLSSAVSQQFRAVYGPHHDLTVPEWRVLATLAQFGTMTAKAIGKHSSMHKTKVSRAVRALEERRWLVRRESEHDRREESLSLTATGLKAYSEIVPRALAFEARILAALGPNAEPLLEALALMEQHFPMD